MKICIYNVDDGETVYNHLPLLVGDIENCTNDGFIEVVNSSDPDSKGVKWPVVEGAFKVLVKLKRGQNLIRLKYGEEILIFKLYRENPSFKHFVRPVYIICEDDDGYFQGPDGEDCSPQSALDRITLGAMLIQTFTAENLKEHGLGRYTFQIETNQLNEPMCHLFRSKLTLERAQSMSGGDLWNHFAKELMESDFDNKDMCKWYCFMSFTRYKPPEDVPYPKTHGEILKYTKGHTALGGGGLALFGTGNLHTWARYIHEIHSRFTDTRKIDRKILMDDSAYREFYWANYATGLGASLHELGHTFNLAHTPTGIMARGFDDFNKVFTVQRLKVRDQPMTKRSNSSSNKTSLPRNISSGPVDGSPFKRSHKSKMNKDICYGSPLRKVQSLSDSSTIDSSVMEPPPMVVKVESNFKPIKSPANMVITMKNYDGTQNLQHISQEHGYETVTDMLLGSEGQILAKTSRRERRAGSCSSSMTCSSTSTPPSPVATVPSFLPNSPEEPFPIPKLAFKDGGAHWYRSSAVLLRYHRWFNKSDGFITKEALTLCSRNKIKSINGLRLVELWKEPDGVVFHHWEFLRDRMPTEFTLKTAEIKDLPEDVQIFTVQAEDNFGNVLRKKIKRQDFEN